MDDIAQNIARLIQDRRDLLAAEIMERFYERSPGSAGKSDAAVREKSLRDVRYHLSYLKEAVESSQPLLYADYIRWLKVTLTPLGLPADAIAASLRLTGEVLKDNLPPEAGPVLRTYIDENLEHFDDIPVEIDSFMSLDAPLASLADQYLRALLDADRHRASRNILEAVEKGTSVRDIYLHVFQPVQREIGRLWQVNRFSVAQEHYVSATTQWIMAQLYPYLFSVGNKQYVFVGACVSGELHEIGMRMVTDFFEMESWDTHYIGANTPPDSLIDLLSERKADMLGISVTITSHVEEARQLIQAVRDSKLAHIKILVGGYPFGIAPKLWTQIGADGYGSDAQQAVSLANRLMASAGS